MEEKEIFEVNRDEYKSFVEQINPEYRDLQIKKIDQFHYAARIYSKINNKCLCSRVYDIREENRDEEKYYIINLPLKKESIIPQPKIQIELTTSKEVQTFIDALNRLKKVQHD